MTAPVTIAALIAAYNRALNDEMRAPYLDNPDQGDRLLTSARATLVWLDKVMLPHDGPTSPVMPGTAVRIRYAGVILRSDVPEQLDWSQITEWRPETI